MQHFEIRLATLDEFELDGSDIAYDFYTLKDAQGSHVFCNSRSLSCRWHLHNTQGVPHHLEIYRHHQQRKRTHGIQSTSSYQRP